MSREAQERHVGASEAKVNGNDGNQGEPNPREIARHYRVQATETTDPAKRKELEAYAADIEAKLIAAEPDQQEG